MLDQKDLEILYYLQLDSRTSLTKLGKLLVLTPAAITYRIQKLHEKQIIKQYTLKINHQVLTPNYQSYLIEANIKHDKLTEMISIVQNTGIFSQIFNVATSNNFLGITKPLSSQDIQLITNIFNHEYIFSFNITPIIKEIDDTSHEDIIAENISKLYCPECQDHFDGKAIITEVRPNQIMGFCCKDCKDRFSIKMEKIMALN